MPLVPTRSVQRPRAITCPTGRTIEFGERPLVMGVLNLTPDSFSDGGLWSDPDRAVDRALDLVAQGADLLDLGAESTRPGGGVYGDGAVEISADEESERLLPVLQRIRDLVSVPISIDTRKASVADRALAAGADLINDISALGDDDLARVIAEHSAPLVLMHSRGSLSSMQRGIRFADVVSEVSVELEHKIEQAVARGIPEQSIIIDPGIGFGKTTQQNLELLRNLDRLDRLGRPVLVGASRKNFIGQISDAGADRRLAGSLAAIGWAHLCRAAIVRVHDVEETLQFIDVWSAISAAERAQT